MNSKKDFSYLLLILSIIFPIVLYYGSMDAFAPMHTIPITEILYLGYVDKNIASTVPEFYIFGAIFTSITGTSAEKLIFYPIQLLPLILLFFIFIKKLSNSIFIAGIVTLIYSVSDLTGNKFFFWIHGMGMVLFFLTNYSLFNLLEMKNKFENKVILIISAISLVFISYDVTFLLIMMEASMIFLLFCNNEMWRKKKSFIIIFFILLIVQLGLSNFVYQNVIPEFKYIQNALDAIEMYFFSFTSDKTANIPITAIAYPKLIGIIAIGKYIILSCSILFAIVIIFKRFILSKIFNNISIVFLSFIFMVIGYGIAKLNLGQVQIGAIFIPGIVSLSIIPRFFNGANHLKKLLSIILISLFLLSITYYLLFNNYNLINIDRNEFKYTEPSAEWYWKYSTGVGVSDIQTNSLFSMYGLKNIQNKTDVSNNMNDLFLTLNSYDNIFLFDENNLNSTVNIRYYLNKGERYYILNKRLNFLSVEQWRTLKPWYYFEQKINDNSGYIKIHTTNDIDILLFIKSRELIYNMTKNN